MKQSRKVSNENKMIICQINSRYSEAVTPRAPCVAMTVPVLGVSETSHVTFLKIRGPNYRTLG